ncbi:MAG TPA: phosphoenolpyruvate--protein phosphotransferase [candidate division Zixibacteria bacterium]|nr:phosphoenolpyruvate--protein phosphotransferase [candidate division Zixibacteria bacterium]
MVRSAQIQGIPASGGVALGEARVVYAWDAMIRERHIEPEDVPAEISRVERAVEKTIAELTRIRDSAGKSLGGPAAKIFDAQLMIAGDFEFIKGVKDDIAARKLNAEAVYSLRVDQSTASLRRSKEPYMRQMLTDIEAVSKKVLANMSGDGERDESPFPPQTIVVAKKLTPADTLRLHERGVAAVVTAEGSAHSHMALIARSLNLPAVVGADRIQNKVRNGTRVIIDGGQGKVFIEPDDALWKSYEKKTGVDALRSIKKLSDLPAFPPLTTDGHTVQLAANIELPGVRDRALAERGVGVGLYRTEFIYLQSNHFPDEAEQFEYYDAIAAQYAPHTVVMRTFDLGSDKYVEELQPLVENNPALGFRGIRTSLAMPQIFRTQLRALLRSSARGNVKIMLPMLTDIDELIRAERVIKRVMVELRRERIPFDQNIQIGVMIEVPSAALTADCFAERAAFFAIGTNDLLQYTMAVDRDNNHVADLYRAFHPAPLKLIHGAITAATRHDRPVSICGEMAGDELALPLLIGMGASSLSMDPSKLHRAARQVAALSFKEMKLLADDTLNARTLKETERIIKDFHKTLSKRLAGA